MFLAIDLRTLFILGLTIVLTSVLAAGLVHRERRGIGFEGVGIHVIYAAGVLSLILGRG